MNNPNTVFFNPLDTFEIDKNLTLYKFGSLSFINHLSDSSKLVTRKEHFFWALSDSNCQNIYWVASTDPIFKPKNNIEEFIKPNHFSNNEIIALGLIYFCSDSTFGHNFSTISYLGRDDTFQYFKTTDLSSNSPSFWHHKIGKYNFHNKSVEVCYYKRVYTKDWDKFRENELKDANGKKVNFRISNKFLKRLVKPKFYRYKKYEY